MSPIVEVKDFSFKYRDTKRRAVKHVDFQVEEGSFFTIIGANGAVTRFRPDERKPGGVYETVSGIVKQIDLIARRIRLLDGTDIPMDDVLMLDGALFDVLD